MLSRLRVKAGHGVPRLWRRLPDAVATRRRPARSLNRLLLALGAPPIVETDMALGHRLYLDLRSGSEWFSHYTGQFDDPRVEAACELLDRPGAVAVDAGANIGFWTVPLARRAAALGGKVIAIEPVPANSERLRENVQLNQLEPTVEIEPVAVSDAHGTATITLREDFASGAATGNAAVLIPDGTDHRFDTVQVSARPLDELLEEYGNPPVDVIKADLEGHEDRFLAGSETTFTTRRPIAFLEWNRTYYHRRGVDPTSTFRPFLRHWNYVCLRRHGRRWVIDDDFYSHRPIDDIVLSPAERARDISQLLHEDGGRE